MKLPTIILASICALSALTLGGCSGWKRRSAPELLLMLTSNNPDERREGIDALAKTTYGREDKFVKVLAAMVESDPHPQVRSAAARAIGVLGNPLGEPSLIKGLKDTSDTVRLDCATVLQNMPSPEAAEPLMLRLSEDSSAEVRAASAADLGDYREDRVLRFLITALADSDFSVIYQAHQSLKKLTGKDLPPDPVEWSEWLKSSPSPFPAPQPEKPSFWRRLWPFGASPG